MHVRKVGQTQAAHATGGNWRGSCRRSRGALPLRVNFTTELRHLGATAKWHAHASSLLGQTNKLLRVGRQVEPAARAAHVDGQHGAAVPPVADANEAAVGEGRRQQAELDGVLDDEHRVLGEQRRGCQCVHELRVDDLLVRRRHRHEGERLRQAEALGAAKHVEARRLQHAPPLGQSKGVEIVPDRLGARRREVDKGRLAHAP
eukprot:scaffold35820_cov65-Phaeocystis_antarctica.AAC.11